MPCLGREELEREELAAVDLPVTILLSLPGRDIMAAIVDSIVVVDANDIEMFERW